MNWSRGRTRRPIAAPRPASQSFTSIRCAVDIGTPDAMPSVLAVIRMPSIGWMNRSRNKSHAGSPKSSAGPNEQPLWPREPILGQEK